MKLFAQHRLLNTVFHNPLLGLLLCLVVGIMVGDYFLPYGFWHRAPQWPDRPALHTAVVTAPPKVYARSLRLNVRLLGGDEMVQLTLGTGKEWSARSEKILPGDLVLFYGKITEPKNAGNPGEMDYAGYLRHHGVRGTGYCALGNWKVAGQYSHPTISERMMRYREGLIAKYESMACGGETNDKGTHRNEDLPGVLAAMTLGDKSRVDDSVRELYSRSGSSHVLALSGLHLSILMSLLLMVFRPFSRGRYRRFLSTFLVLVCSWTFVMLTGAPTSLLRAATMLSLMTIFRSFSRSASNFHVLLLAVICLLLINPHNLYDVGFQLSVVSVSGIIIGVSLLPGQNREQRSWFFSRIRYRFIQFFVVSLAAQLVTLPLVAHYFGTVSLVGLLSVWIVIPAAYVLVVGGLLWLALPSASLFSFLQSIIGWVLSVTIDGVHGFLAALASLSFASVDLSLSWWGVAGCYGLLFWILYCYLHPRKPMWTIAALIVIVIIGTEQTIDFLNRPQPQVVILNHYAKMDIRCDGAKGEWYGDVLVCGRRKVAVMKQPVHLDWIRSRSVVPLPVDVLLLTKGAKGHVADYLLLYQPHLVVLDGCLSDYYRQHFSAEIASLNLPFYDVRESGALILPLEDNPKVPTKNSGRFHQRLLLGR